MKFSAFAPFGLLALSGEMPTAERIYNDLVRGYGGADGDLNVVAGTYLEGKSFATALELAAARKYLLKAKGQAFAETTDSLIANREAEFGIVPDANANIVERREELARRQLVPDASSAVNLEQELIDLLGSDFIALRLTPISEAIANPANVGDAPANLQRPEVVRKTVSLGAVSFIGVAQTVPYTLVATPTAGDNVDTLDLVPGDVIVVDPGRSIADRVTVTSVGVGTFTATFAQPHDAGARGFTAPLPSQCSTKRHTVVVITDEAAADPVKRRNVHDHLTRRMRATSTWGITGGTSSTTTQLEVGAFGLGMTTLAPIAL